MANLADEYGTDVEIYIKALTTTIHADTPTGAPASLHDLLEQLGLERHEYPAGEPLYIWHTVPDHLGAEERKRLANRAIPALLLAGYTVNCDPEVFDEALYQQAVHRLRAPAARPAPPRSNRCPPVPPRAPHRPAAPRKPERPRHRAGAAHLPAARFHGETRSRTHTCTDQAWAQTPARNSPVPPLSTRLHHGRSRPRLPTGRRPPGSRPHRSATRRAAPTSLTVHAPGGACPAPPPFR